MAELRQNTWTLDEWYAQDVAGQVSYKFGGSLYTWGTGSGGRLGQNDQTSRSSPTQVGTATSWKYLWVGHSGSVQMAIKSDNTLWSWGEDDQGIQGQNADVKKSSPMQIGENTNWSKVQVGRASAGAINEDGELYVWGWNSYGVLGQNQGGVSNAAQRYSSPTQIPGDWKDISFGYEHVGGVKTDGTLWMWGNGSGGRLGLNQGTFPGRSSPAQVGTDTTWDKISSGILNSLVSKTDGTLWTWGSATDGLLGQNGPTNQDRSSPMQVPGTWAQFATNNGEADPRYCMGVKTNGALYVWGRGYQGQLGLGGPTSGNWVRRSTPTQIPGTWDVDLSAGGHNTLHAGGSVCCKRADGDWYVWGKQSNGGLGLNEGGPAPSETKASPVQLPGTWDLVQLNENGAGGIKHG